MRESTQVTPEAREGELRAKAGRNTQSNSSSDHQDGKPVKLFMVSNSRMHLTRLNGTYFK
jgi:hypothetical protein